MGPFPSGTGRCRPLRERFARSLPVTVGTPRDAVMTTPAVVFGGPSDEHDISILTGLQVSHALKEVVVFYWSKGGEWFQVDPGAEASEFVEGPPRKARAVTLVPEVGKGFVGKKPIPVSADHQRLSRRTGRGRDPPGDARSGRHPLHRSRSGRLGSRYGQVRLRGVDGGQRACPPCPGPCWLPPTRAHPHSRVLTSSNRALGVHRSASKSSTIGRPLPRC